MSQIDRPNVVLLKADDQRFDTIGALGGDAATPNLDRLVEEGCVFTRAHNHGIRARGRLCPRPIDAP